MSSLSMQGRPRLLDRVNDSPPWWRRVDVVLLGTALAIAVVGVLMVLSSTRSGTGSASYSGFAVRQAIWVALGLAVMTAVSLIDYRKYWSGAPWLYGLVLAVLFFVLSPLGQSSKGAQAWFQIGGFQLQPSEWAKIVVILALSSYCARQATFFGNRHALVVVAIAVVPMGLIMLQPDLGTVLVFAAITFGILLVAGAPARSMVALVLIAVVVSVGAIEGGALKQYQLDRLGAFLDPNTNTQQSTYNLNQSKIAIGSGAIVGKGLFQGTQTNLRYVPEQHTDFIFTVVGEELGLVGSATLLALFAILIWRMWQSAKLAPDTFGSLLCVGVMVMFTFQIFENVGMTMGIMPITGIPLPFVSYGGSSTIACFAGLGLVLNVRFRATTA